MFFLQNEVVKNTYPKPKEINMKVVVKSKDSKSFLENKKRKKHKKSKSL